MKKIVLLLLFVGSYTLAEKTPSVYTLFYTYERGGEQKVAPLLNAFDTKEKTDKIIKDLLEKIHTAFSNDGKKNEWTMYNAILKLVLENRGMLFSLEEAQSMVKDVREAVKGKENQILTYMYYPPATLTMLEKYLANRSDNLQ